ncbi:3'-5' exonuclease [Streptococcus tangpeifui]|uniref:DNA polymerase III, epsilon subunit n=1 Tax=Streptococcus criceti HS-6 TaxID=873449 RepID=G5JRC4_STRCG|nr:MULTISPECIES: 3'-5' exonuclease [Streptococcus]EHI73941.1 DNA polymerase III, epsilon subunit [Streptococcus criceti HS-6]SUN43754.1 DNA polymerase III subunit epsilon [Streptococcus criceti]
MEKLDTYIAFDLEFNTVEGVSHIIQISAVKFDKHEEAAQFDSYVYSSVPLQSFINGLTGITADKISQAPKIDQVLDAFKSFIGDTPLIGYNAHKSDLPILAENGLGLATQYKLDIFDEAYERRSTDLNGIVNLKLTSVADFLGIKGRGHDSLEDARMTARVYEAFLELDSNKDYLNQQEEAHGDNPFAALGDLFD